VKKRIELLQRQPVPNENEQDSLSTTSKRRSELMFQHLFYKRPSANALVQQTESDPVRRHWQLISPSSRKFSLIPLLKD
jgi:hypothetical protein